MAYGVLQIEAGFDLADFPDVTFDVVETGGNTFTTTMSTGAYFLRTDASAVTGDFASKVTSYGSFIQAVEDDWNSQGAAGGTYTLSFNATTELVSISHDGGGSVTAVSITPTSGGGLLGLSSVKSGALSYNGDRTPDYYIGGTIGYWASWREYEREPDALVDVVAHDGTPHGLAPAGIETWVDFDVPMEPRAMIYTRAAASASPWVWQDLFRHARNTEPLAVYDGEETHFLRLRKEGAAFRPQPVTRDYVGHYDVPIRARLLGRA